MRIADTDAGLMSETNRSPAGLRCWINEICALVRDDPDWSMQNYQMKIYDSNLSNAHDAMAIVLPAWHMGFCFVQEMNK